MNRVRSIAGLALLRRPLANAFTLVEVLVVLIIVAIVVAAVTVSLKQPFHAAQLQNAVELSQLVDRQLRDHARASKQPALLIMDLDHGVWEINEQRDEGEVSREVAFQGVKVHGAWTAHGRLQYGRVVVPVSSKGETPSYAVCLRARSGGVNWVVFAGQTGHSHATEWEGEVAALFDIVAASRADAN